MRIAINEPPKEVNFPLTPAQAIAVIVFMTRAYPYNFEWQGVLVDPDTPRKVMFQFHLPNGAKVYASADGQRWYIYCLNSTYTLSSTEQWLRDEVGLDTERTAPAVRTEALRLPDFSKDPAILKLHEQMGITND